MATKIQGGSNTAGLQNVNANYQAEVITEVDVENLPQYVGATKQFSEVDAGIYTGEYDLLSPETDDDYRLRVATDTILDYEEFDYTSQNTGKHFVAFTTLVPTCTAAGINSNSTSLTTTTTGMTFGTHAMFPMFATQTNVVEISASFSAQPNANQIIDFGLFLRGAANPFAPTDGVYFRLTSAGLFGVINSNTSETTTAVFKLSDQVTTWTYTNNTVYRFLIQVTNVRTTFWVNNDKLGEIPTPSGLNMPFKSATLPVSWRHAIVGGAGGAALQFLVADYKIGLRGAIYAENFGNIMSRVLGTYQGLSGGTMGTIGTYTNNTNPTAAVPTNTTAAVGAVGPLNQAWETFSLAVNTDGILLSYQVPLGTALVQGRRMKINGVKLSSFVQTVLVGGPISRVFCLAFGHSTVTMAGTETGSMVTATTKNRRIVLLPELTQHVTAAQAVNTAISQPGGCVSTFMNPIYVNPGEFVAVTVKGIGTVGTSGTIVNHIQLDYTWE